MLVDKRCSKIFMLEKKITEVSLLYIEIILYALLFFGSYFSKFNLFGPIYLYEVLLLLPIPILLLKVTIKRTDWPFLLVFAASLIYLILSFLKSSVGVDIIIRQFMLFGYLLIAFLYFSIIRKLDNYFEKIKKCLIQFANISAFLQLIYIAFVFLFVTKNIYAQGSYFYYSPICVMGMLLFSVSKLVYSKQKLPWLIFAAFLLTTTGHSSAFLALLIVVILYYMFKITIRTRFFFLVVCTIIVAAFILTTNYFTDANAQWRLVFWLLTLKNVFIEHYGILGNGFGVPYTDDNANYILEVINGFTGLQSDDTEKYLSPMHNSFLTMAFHIGFIFALLILLPIIKAFGKFFISSFPLSKDLLFFTLSLIALSVWSATNVILELPHSSLLFWLVYFVYTSRIKTAEV